VGKKAILTIHGDDYDGKLREDRAKRKSGYILRVYVQEAERRSNEGGKASRIRRRR